MATFVDGRYSFKRIPSIDLRKVRLPFAVEPGVGTSFPNQYDKRRRHKADADFRRNKSGELVLRVRTNSCPWFFGIVKNNDGTDIRDDQLSNLFDYIGELLANWLCDTPDECPEFLEG